MIFKNIGKVNKLYFDFKMIDIEVKLDIWNFFEIIFRVEINRFGFV